MDKAANEPLTVEKSLTACALVSFAVDSPVVPQHTEEQRLRSSPNLRSVQRDFRRAGLASVARYFEALAVTTEVAAPLVEVGFSRPLLPIRLIPLGDEETWPYLHWPESQSTWRALTAYWSAMVCVALPARILNFWRAVEAVTSKDQRHLLFRDLHEKRVSPVKTRVWAPQEKVLNAALTLKRLAVKRRNTLVEIHGNPSRALDWLYWERRGKAAHADRSSLDLEGLTSLGAQLSDATLFQYMARVAIEENWA